MKIKSQIAIIIALLTICHLKLSAQEKKPSAIQIHGHNVIIGQYSNMIGYNQNLPPSFLRNDFRITLSVFNIPVSANYFYTTEPSFGSSKISNFRLYFNPQEIIQNRVSSYADKKVKGFIDEKTPWIPRLIKNFNTIEIGRCRPNYTDFTLKGISMDGVNVEFNPGLLYAAFSKGQTNKSFYPSAEVFPSFEQNLLFGRLGIGKKNASHLFLTYLQVEDNSQSIPDHALSDTIYLKPHSNNIISAEAALSFFDNKLAFEGEIATSFFTRDNRYEMIELDSNILPPLFSKLIKPNLTSTYDFAYSMRSALNLNNTKVSFELNKIGPGYTSLGNPYMINDRMSFNGSFDQYFAKKQISVSGFYRQSYDNLINWKAAQTNILSYGGTIMFRFRKLPYLRISYMPNFQSMQRNNLKLNNSVIIFNGSAGYNYKLKGLRMNTNINYLSQDIETILDTLSSLRKVKIYSLSHDITFNKPLSLNAAVSYNQAIFPGIDINTLIYSIGATHSAFKKKWQNKLGFKFSNQFNEQNKLGFYVNSRLNLGKNSDLSIRFEQNFFNDEILIGNSYDEFIGQVCWEIKW